MNDEKKICVICKKEFYGRRNAITCSLECSNERRRERQRKYIKQKECKHCGKIFNPLDYHVRYCSDKCRETAQRKNKHVESNHRYKVSKEIERIRKNSKGDEIARKAKEAGMSYGMYVAIQHGLPKVEL